MQADQTVLSLRPGGGGGNRGSRVLGHRVEPSSGFGSSSLSSDLPLLRPHGGAPSSFYLKTGDSRFEGHERVRYSRDQLLQLREVGNIPEAILKIKQEVEAEFFGEDQNWGHVESSPPIQPQNHYFEPDNRDWGGRSAQFPASGKGRSWENKEFGGRFDSRQQKAGQHNRQDQLNLQFSRAQRRETIIEIFYEKHLGQLIDVITSSCPPNGMGQSVSKSVGSNGSIENQIRAKPEILLNICELLCFCVFHHQYRIKCNFLLNNMVDKVLFLTRRREKYLVVAAVRFFRTLISRNDTE